MTLAREPEAGKTRRARDPERTRARLLEAAKREFADHGYEGARVERVVRAARVTTRMLYHYFGNKELLYLAVLDAVYAEIRAGERALDLESGAPDEALARLVGFTFDFFQRNDAFVRLTRGENMLEGRFLKRSRMIQDMSQPLLDAIARLLARGVSAGTFRENLDPLQLYVTIVALGAHHLNNVHTLSAVFGRDLQALDWLTQRRTHAIEMTLRYATAVPHLSVEISPDGPEDSL